MLLLATIVVWSVVYGRKTLSRHAIKSDSYPVETFAPPMSMISSSSSSVYLIGGAANPPGGQNPKERLMAVLGITVQGKSPLGGSCLGAHTVMRVNPGAACGQRSTHHDPS